MRDCPESVMLNRSRPCLEHQLGLCSAPCVDLIDEHAYTGMEFSGMVCLTSAQSYRETSPRSARRIRAGRLPSPA